MITDLQAARLVYWTRRHRDLLSARIASGTGLTVEVARELEAVERLLLAVDPPLPPDPPGLRNSRGHVD